MTGRSEHEARRVALPQCGHGLGDVATTVSGHHDVDVAHRCPPQPLEDDIGPRPPIELDDHGGPRDVHGRAVDEGHQWGRPAGDPRGVDDGGDDEERAERPHQRPTG